MAGKYSPYPKYKASGDSRLGDIPEQWQLTRVKYVAEITPKKPVVDRSLDCSFIPMEKLKTDTLVLDEIRKIDAVYDGYTYFADDDILMAKVTPCFENRNIAIATDLKNKIGFGSSEIYTIRTTDEVNNRFLFYRLQEDGFMDLAIGSMTGAGGLKRVPSETVANYQYASPEGFEQTQIANFLDHETAKIDTLIEKQQQLIELLKEKRQAVISHAVTKGLNANAPMKDSGVEWLGEVPEHWDVSQLKYQVKPGTSITYGIVQAGPHIEGGIPYIKTSDMSGEALPLGGYSKTSKLIDDSYKRSKVYEGDLVIGIRASVGKCLPVPKEISGANLTQGTAKISPTEGLHRDFLLAYLSSSPVQTHLNTIAKGATFKEITLDMLRRVSVLVPPEGEQEKVTERVSALSIHFRCLIDASEKQMVLLSERRIALISAAVTGKIDVRGWQPSETQGADI